MNREDDWDFPDDEGEEGDDYITVEKTALEAVENEIEFERKFYEAVCDTDKFEIIPVPDEQGHVITDEERRLIAATARQHGIKILYRVSHGKFATVYDPATGKVGVMPENNSNGFTC